MGEEGRDGLDPEVNIMSLSHTGPWGSYWISLISFSHLQSNSYWDGLSREGAGACRLLATQLVRGLDVLSL